VRNVSGCVRGSYSVAIHSAGSARS
jgi:hypothetical protein